jgi:hypothetical protein
VGLVVVGVDVGQRVDPTAIAVCEREGDRYLVRHLERLKLGTSYPDVASRVGEVYRGILSRQGARLSEEQRHAAVSGDYHGYATPEELLAERAKADTFVVVDATGVGTPVIDLIRERGGINDYNLTGCFFTYGDKLNGQLGRKEASVGKGYLVSRLQALIQSKRIQLPHTAEARALAEELLVYEIHVDENANAKYGAFKVGTHDDLVTALGLAVLFENRYTCGSARYA